MDVRISGTDVDSVIGELKKLPFFVEYFDRFDTYLVGDSYRGEGPYLKLRFKFDENTLCRTRN
jgi:hypothetical protein